MINEHSERPTHLDGPIGDDVAAFFLLELVLATLELTIVEVQLFVGRRYADLVLGHGLARRGHLLVDRVVEAEPVYLPCEGLDGLELRATNLGNLELVFEQHCDHVGSRKVLHIIDLSVASLDE